jgi:DNA-binding NtrC family response regulator
MEGVYERIQRLAPLSIPVLVMGETGTGKDLAARTIARIWGPGRPFVRVSCGAIPPTLLESELFGCEKGAFTGAVAKRNGLLAVAHGGTLFLDEIAELPIQAQAKLLQAIETGEYRPLGMSVERRSDFRLIAATHRDLEQLVVSGAFREDLLHRLGAARIAMPPLRDRREDIEPLARFFLSSLRSGGLSHSVYCLTPGAGSLLTEADWPGNVRQLRNVVEAAAATAVDRVIETCHIVEARGGFDGTPNVPHSTTLAAALARAEVAAIASALKVAGGNRQEAARMLGIGVSTLHRKLGKLRSGTCDSQLGEAGSQI